MKTTLTAEQSAALIKRGVNPDKASQSFAVAQAAANVRGLVRIPPQPIFTLADLFALLPKTICEDYSSYDLAIFADNVWEAAYIGWSSAEIEESRYSGHGVELIDALLSLVCKLLGNHVKLN